MKQDSQAPLGRRERNKAEKLERIFAAGDELFETRDANSVTTQEIAERADIGAGTLFQYVASKAELLLMVHNRRFAQAVADGAAAQERVEGLRPRLLAALRPAVECNRHHPANGRTYIHEVVFGDQTERYRSEAHGIVAKLRAVVRKVLLETGAASAETADASAEVVFAVFYLTLCDAITAHHGSEQLLERIDVLLATHFHDWDAAASTEHIH